MSDEDAIALPPLRHAVLLLNHDDAELLDTWTHGLAPKSADQYRRVAHDYLGAARKPLREIGLRETQIHLERIASTRKPSTVRHHTDILKSLWHFAYRLRRVPYDVGKELRRPKVARGTHRVLSAEEVYSLLRAPRRQAHRAFLRTLFASGARVSEVLNLRWHDVRDAPEEGAAILALVVKGGEAHHVWIPPSVAAELRAIRAGAGDLVHVFASSKRPGYAIRADGAGAIVTEAAKRAGIAKPVTPHWLRHSHATIATDNKCPLHLVQSTLGHASLATTGVYLHSRPTESSARYLGL